MVLALAPWFGPVDSSRNRLELWTSVSLVYITPSWDYTPSAATLTLLILVCFLYGLPLAQAQGCLYPVYTPRFRSHSSRIRLDPRTCRCNPWCIYHLPFSCINLTYRLILASVMSTCLWTSQKRRGAKWTHWLGLWMVRLGTIFGSSLGLFATRAMLMTSSGDPQCFTGSLQSIGWSGRTIR